MKVTGKIMNGSELVGIELTDNISIRVSPMALYLETNITTLVQSGYTYYDYDPTHITLPNGDSIMSVPTLELDENTKVQLAMSKRSLSMVLSDAQASKYYSSPENNGGMSVEFKKYDGPWLINTREELIEYVNAAESHVSYNPCSFLVRPFNTLVNPDIWFTPEEIIQATDNLYNRILNLRKWGNFDHYKATCNFFVEQGLMQENDYSVRALMQAWYAYGPDLIKGQYTNTSFNYKVDGSFEFNDQLFESKKDGKIIVSLPATNRTYEVGVYNSASGDVSTASGKTVNVDGIVSLDRGTRYDIWIDDMVLNTLKATDSDYDLRIVGNVGVKDETDRFICAIYSDGRTFEFKADFKRVLVAYRNQKKCMSAPMLMGTAINGVYTPIDRVDSELKYKKLIMAQMYAIINCKRASEDPIDFSNISYLSKLNMGTIATIRKVCARKNMDSIILEQTRGWEQNDFLTDALNMYAAPIPQYIMDAFDLSECDSKEDFLSQVDIDKYLISITPEESGHIDETSMPVSWIDPSLGKAKAMVEIQQRTAMGIEHEPYHYYRFIETVHNILNGKEKYGCLEEGLQDDAQINTEVAMNGLLAIASAVVGPDASLKDFENVLNNLGEYINVGHIYRRRTKGATGYVLDFADDAHLMFSDRTPYWMYVSRVYRELSNLPVEQQRPYLVEAILFGNGNEFDLKVRQAFTKLVEVAMNGKSIVPDYNYEQGFKCRDLEITSSEELSKKFAGYIAAQLMFKVLNFAKMGRISTEADYKETVQVFDDVSFEVTVPAAIVKTMAGIDLEAHRKFITLDFLTTFEVNGFEKDGPSQFACVNAAITPWSVNPLKGYSIKSYPLLQNFYDTDVLVNSFGQERTTALINNGVKITQSLKAIMTDENKFMPAPPVEGKKIRDEYQKAEYDSRLALYNTLLTSASSYHDYDDFLDMSMQETLEIYIKRWTAARNEAKAQGKTLLSIPLKQDILYGEIGQSMGFDINTEPLFTTDDVFKSNYLSDVVLDLRGTTRIEMKATKSGAVLSPINIKNVDEDIVEFFEQLSELPILPAYARYGTVVLDGRVAGLTWAKENFVKLREGKWFGRLQNGFYVIEEV